MPSRPFSLITAALTSAAMVTSSIVPAQAWTNGSSHYTPSHSTSGCNGGGVSKPTSYNKNISIYKPTTINKNIDIYKPTTITKNINIYKPTTINKNIDIYKPITINKNIDITKNIDNSKNITINKNININKSIVINKGGSGGGTGSADAEASAFAQAMAQASANASASASANNNVVFYGGGSYEYVTVNNHSSDISGIRTTAQCQMQEANVVKAIHAVCLSVDGREFPASHMMGDTWVESSFEGEIMRCIPGSHLKVTIGDVVQSDQGMAGLYERGQILECDVHEALRHFKDGMLKCAPAVPVPDCTERTNLRRYGTGDLFFSYRASVCVSTQTSQRETRELDVTGMALEGGVGTN
jgi:hypothetical protein